ncbi:hypothetical protein JZ751_016465 [Albula glossodonta]|uniref:SH2 domain-containing protein n=1 Tax=Albula glossodonta TaxID=121402 RepID=A0A8T2NNP1_9TELE|nr:hypothetical protein JZ751_016465 [Albula glossodonta]
MIYECLLRKSKVESDYFHCCLLLGVRQPFYNMAAQCQNPRLIDKRGKITALPMYHSGHLQKKFTGEKYTERLELVNLKAIQVDSSSSRTNPTIYILSFRDEEVQLKFNDPDKAEEWRGFIMTVATVRSSRRSAPSHSSSVFLEGCRIYCKLQLLPGQIMKLEQALKEERARTDRVPTPILVPVPHISMPPTDSEIDFPQCYYPVSRQEAEQMLEGNPAFGSIILRPAASRNNYAITMRQIMPSGPEMKHYKVRSRDSGFIIELDVPVIVPSLQAVVDHFLNETHYSVRPYIQSNAYDTRIVVPTSTATQQPKPAALPLRPAPRVEPMIHTKPNPPSKPGNFTSKGNLFH